MIKFVRGIKFICSSGLVRSTICLTSLLFLFLILTLSSTGCTNPLTQPTTAQPDTVFLSLGEVNPGSFGAAWEAYYTNVDSDSSSGTLYSLYFNYAITRLSQDTTADTVLFLGHVVSPDDSTLLESILGVEPVVDWDYLEQRTGTAYGTRLYGWEELQSSYPTGEVVWW